MNRASGNISSNRRMRQVCGGDLRRSGRLYLSVNFFRNSSRVSRHRSIALGAAVRKVKYFSNRSFCLGKIQAMQGDLRLAAQSANSSSCGEESAISTLSIGLRGGIKNESSGVSAASVLRK